MAHFEIDTDSAGQYIWRLRASGNNEIIARGESYKEKDDCERAVGLVKEQASSARVDDLT